jgi:hypothetical protein
MTIATLRMSQVPILLLGACMVCATLIQSTASAAEFRRLSVAEYCDKMAAGWVGQMAGVGWGGPTEFKWKGEIIPEDKMPVWRPGMVNQFHQDDIYVEMTFLRTLELYGFDVSFSQAGIDFANSGYPLWHANRAGRDNLRSGIAPPDSGHPKFNKHADDIDYQIEADFSGLIAPGMPNVAIELGEKFGRLINYGDGLYGGQFVGGMYAEAFFEDDPVKLVEVGLECIPAKSQYAECIRDVLEWYREEPKDWQKTWGRINEKYHLNPDYRRFSCSGPSGEFNIDAKINGAYIAMGLLYGNRDPDATIVISTRCGQDSDCNPANAGGVLFTTMGMSKLPERFTSELDRSAVFSHTEYSFSRLVKVCEALVRQAVVRSGGRIERGSGGEEVFVIPVVDPKPGKLEQCWEPGPAAGSRFTEDELEKIEFVSAQKRLQQDLEKVLPGWKMSHCGPDMEPGIRAEFAGKKNVFMTHPQDRSVGCVLAKTVDVPAAKKTVLRTVVAHDPRGDWTLVVKANGKQLLKMPIRPDAAIDGWVDVEADLSDYAGESVKLELINQADGWSFEAGYWSKIAVESR